MKELSLYKVLKKSYEHIDNADLADHGYHIDKELSNHHNKIYYNPETHQILMTVAGTNPLDLHDLHADFKLGFGGGSTGQIASALINGAIVGPVGLGAGLAFHKQFIGNGLKETDRYQSAHKTLREAKKKYKVNRAILAAHSLGGTIVGGIAQRNDDIYTFNKGVTIGQKTRPNEKAYRIQGDLVSALSDKATATVLKPYRPQKIANLRSHHKVDHVQEILPNHALEHLQHQPPIFITPSSPVVLGKATRPIVKPRPAIQPPPSQPIHHNGKPIMKPSFRENL